MRKVKSVVPETERNSGQKGKEHLWAEKRKKKVQRVGISQ